MNDPSIPEPLRPSEPQRLALWRLYGPLALVLALVAGLLVAVVATSPEAAAPPSTTGGPDRGPESIDEVQQLPPGVQTFARARQQGLADEIDWGPRCDATTGKVKLPQWPLPDCFAPFEGDNGGATTRGVDATTIKVVIYLAQANDPVLRFIYDQIGNTDTPDDTFATYEGFVEIFNTYYELYGRRIELVRYDATGPVNDATAAVADAEAIARDLQPFAVIGGPSLTNAFADTLSRQGVICVACTPGQPAEWYSERAPYVWDVQRNADQSLLTVAEYVGKRLAGRPARNAGDPALRTEERVFGLIRVQSSDASQVLEDRFTARLRDDYDVELAAIQTYGLPTELAGSGKDIITAMKEAGVTTVIFSGDPLGPQSLTRIATEQGFFPEWVLGAVTLVDTAIFSRTYDQQQWAHAFGPSGLFVRTPSTLAGAGFVYRWYFGEEAPAATNVPLIAGPLQVIYGSLQGVGPNVTPDMFQRVLFGSPIYPSTPISPQISFGNRGVYPDPDFGALDDATEVWWDPDAEGESETGRAGTGLWRFVDGGKRYLPGEWPATEPDVFDPDTAILGYDEIPPEIDLPVFEPLRPGS